MSYEDFAQESIFGPCSYRHLVDRIAGRNLRGSLPKIREVTIGTDECDELSV